MLGIIFVFVFLFYAGAFLIGWHLSTGGRLDLQRLIQSRRQLTDPLTTRFQRWHDRAKMNALRQGQWIRLWLVMSANNLFAVAFVSRTLYAVTLALPTYMTYRQGLVQGAFFARPSMRPSGLLIRVAVLEFGAYLLATALGVNLVVSFSLTGSLRSGLLSLILFYPVVAAAVLGGAWLEIQLLRAKMPAGFRIPENLNMEEIRAKALEMTKIERRHNEGMHPTAQKPGGG